MTTFAILTSPTTPPATQDVFLQAMTRVFGDTRFRQVDAGQFLAVRDGATSQQITNELGGQGQAGNFIVVASAGYWGFYDKAVWEWLVAVGAS